MPGFGQQRRVPRDCLLCAADREFRESHCVSHRRLKSKGTRTRAPCRALPFSVLQFIALTIFTAASENVGCVVSRTSTSRTSPASMVNWTRTCPLVNPSAAASLGKATTLCRSGGLHAHWRDCDELAGAVLVAAPSGASDCC